MDVQPDKRINYADVCTIQVEDLEPLQYYNFLFMQKHPIWKFLQLQLEMNAKSPSTQQIYLRDHLKELSHETETIIFQVEDLFPRAGYIAISNHYLAILDPTRNLLNLVN